MTQFIEEEASDNGEANGKVKENSDLDQDSLITEGETGAETGAEGTDKVKESKKDKKKKKKESKKKKKEEEENKKKKEEDETKKKPKRKKSTKVVPFGAEEEETASLEVTGSQASFGGDSSSDNLNSACETPVQNGTSHRRPARMAEPREILSMPTEPWTVIPRPADEQEEDLVSADQLYNYLNDGQLSPYLFDPTYILMVDTRSVEEYQTHHIVTAVHYTELQNPVMVQPLADYTHIVVYDDKGLTYSLTDSVLSMRLEEYKQQNLEPCMLQGGYQAFYDKYSFLCNSRTLYTEKGRHEYLKAYPSVILEDKLYLGRGDQAENLDIVTNLGITHILNITKEYKNVFEDRLAYLHVSLEDEPGTDLQSRFLKMSQFIHDGIRSGGRVLVHCTQGVSRSSTAVISYLMITNKWSLKHSFKFVLSRRAIISPNRGFVKQLSSFEKKLYGKKLSPSDEDELRLM